MLLLITFSLFIPVLFSQTRYRNSWSCFRLLPPAVSICEHGSSWPGQSLLFKSVAQRIGYSQGGWWHRGQVKLCSTALSSPWWELSLRQRRSNSHCGAPVTILHCWKGIIFPMRNHLSIFPVQPCSLAPVPKLSTREQGAFHPGWIHEEWTSSLQAKVNLCSSWERTHTKVKVKKHILGVIVSDFLKFYFSESFFSFFPSQLLSCWAAQETKQSVGIEIFARLKKTPFTLTNDGLHLFSIPLMCL